MKRSVKTLVDEAMAQVTTYTVEQARALHGEPGVQFVDVRDVRELEREGVIPGALHAPRGMLEFWVDPESPYHRDVFAQDNVAVVREGQKVTAVVTKIDLIEFLASRPG